MTNLIFQTQIGEVTLGDYPWHTDTWSTLLGPRIRVRQIGSLLQTQIIIQPVTVVKEITIPINFDK